MKLLLINGSPRLTESTGKKILTSVVKDYVHDKYEISSEELIDVFNIGLEKFSSQYMERYLDADKPKTENDIEQEKVRTNILNQFIEADIVIFNVPKYNFSYPVVMKMYIDTLYQRGITYDTKKPTGSKGMLAAKKEIIALVTNGDEDVSLEGGLERSIFDAFEYLNLEKELKIITIPDIHGSYTGQSIDDIKSYVLNQLK